MSKQYGLIDPKINKGKIAKKLAVFDSESDSDSQDQKRTINAELGESQKRQIRVVQERALAEDPTIYQYDELYDEMDNKRKEAKTDKSKEDRKPKYINKLLETAEKRKKDLERRIERQVQKEREAEGEMYKDKESFVTSAYRTKLEEMKKADEEEKREEYLESIADVTKQSDLGGFYRHIYSQKIGETGSKKEVNDDEKNQCDTGNVEETKDQPQISDENTEQNFIKDKQVGTCHSRRYRKRHSDEEGNLDDEKNDLSKKVHLQSNLDADSDFSIDSHSNSSENEDSDDDNHNEKVNEKETESAEMTPTKKDHNETKQPSNGVEVDQSNIPNESAGIKSEVCNETKTELKERKLKIDIWKKRTVGAVFDSALQRYYERKASRESG
ncbi:nuclear speckle splicing regulatory protein 1 [Malaya genurostris]|uniref:nuclear speckle splicing regulatory protein 1 n=1 Tax=Malaya genurostris TaxID=325434 RepID=UPI0026F3D1E7|nr:nuclear speckle splicing regulatory protein 1 [Malaya genurostris]